MNRLTFCLPLMLLLCGALPRADGALIVYTAALDGPSEDPPNASPGTGFARIGFDPIAHVLDVYANFTGLIGTTTNAHVHAPTAVPGAGIAGVATATPTFPGFPSGVTSGTYQATFDTTLASTWNPAFVTAHGGSVANAEAAFGAYLAEGRAYFNIHSTFRPAGEIRGFLQPVPEPASMLVWGVGALGLIGIATRRRRPAHAPT